MEDVSLVGVHDDGEHLLLAGPNGQRFRLHVDDALRAAVRRDRARLSQLQLQSEGRLRPREIQARIRAGETAEEVADSAGLDLDHVRRYEGPVLAEREYVADQARQVRLRRGGGQGDTLGEMVTERLVQREVDLETVGWDAWRGEDGTWTVALDFEAGSSSRQARWSYNASVRHVTALDDEARWLTDEETPSSAGSAQRRLAPVRDRVFDIEAITSSRPIPDDPPAVELLETLRERRGRRNRPLTEDEELAGMPDPVREAIDSLLSRADAMGEPPAAHPARSRPQDARDGEVLVLPDADTLGPLLGGPGHTGTERSGAPAGHAGPGRPTSGSRPDDEPEIQVTPDDETPVGAGAGRRPTTGGNRKQRRASVPSWDDIVFGQRRD